MTFSISWFIALGAIMIGIGAYHHDKSSYHMGCMYCAFAMILDIIDLFV